jgi:triphosphoribosyl-dephospho-CoA synthase
MEDSQNGEWPDSLFPHEGHQTQWSIASAVQLACVLEATAPKIGNVHPGRAFTDMTYDDFLKSAIAVRQVFERVSELSVGQLILSAIQATRAVTSVNTNLGMILLLAPLAKSYWLAAPNSLGCWRSEVRQQLAALSADDSQCVYQAIQAAKPGGIGQVQLHDVCHDAPSDLITAMQQVANFDAVARQYTSAFEDIFCRLVPWLEEALEFGNRWCPGLGQSRDTFEAICAIQLRWMAKEPDGLIVRKAGMETATLIQNWASEVLAQSDPVQSRQKLLELDRFLCTEGNRYNPGTTADLIAATLFVRLMCGRL